MIMPGRICVAGIAIKTTPYSLWFWDFTDASAQGQSRKRVSNRRL
jgi:hypothetical protein